MNRQIRFTALLLAVCLFLNSVAFPAAAEGDLEPTQETTEVTTVPTEELIVPAENGSAPTEEATEPAEEAFVPTEGVAEPTPRYKPEGNTLLITSSRELLLLSYLDPWEYCDLNLTFSPSDEENAGFDLTTALDGLQFQGLGSEEYPFRGEILFADGTGPIALNRPLFNALSDDAKITGLSLESHVQGVAEGGLLAKTVTHGQGGNTWVVTLTQPEPAENAEINLPPLIFNLGNNTDVSLDVTDLSGLSVLGSGYLCAVMGENARLTLSGIDTIPAVTGSSDAVGGLVGLMKSGASLTVTGESLTFSSVNGNCNVGGIVGSATDPLLSLPSVVGCDGAVVSGVNVGGLIGRLTYMPGDHRLSVTLSSLTLEGSDNAGGLVGVLLRDAGTLTLDAQVEGIVLAEGAINCGSLFGTYYTSSPENPLILNGEPIAEEAELEALAGLVDYPGKLEIFVTVEDAQAIIDSILNAELRPGEMSPLWWAVVSGKLTAEELAAQLNAYYSGATETDPAEETEPTEEPQSQETTQEEAEDSPETASFSLQAQDSSSDEQVCADALTNSEEEAPSSQETETAEPNFALLESLVSSYARDPELNWPAGKSEYEITSEKDLVLLSYVAPSSYANGTITININTGTYFLDLTKSWDIKKDETNTLTLPFYGLGDSNEGESFAGSIKFESGSEGTYIKLDQPLFHALSDKAEIALLNLYSGLLEALPASNPTALLAEKITHDSNVTEFPETPWGINLRGISGRSSLPLIGTLSENSLVNVNLSLCVGAIKTTDDGDTENSFTSIADCSSLTVRGGGYLCGTMETGAQLTVNLTRNEIVYNGGITTVTPDATKLGVPKVTSSGAVGGLVGTMGTGAKLTVNAASTVPVPIKAVESTDGNAGGLVGTMGEGASVTVKLDGEGAALSLSDVTAKNNAGGLVGEATNPVFLLPNISGLDGSVITSTGLDAGGIIGKLTVNPGNEEKFYDLKNTITGLTVSAKESSGGLFGLLINGGGKYTIKDTNTTVTFSSSGKAGGLIGSYAATNLRDTLILEDNTTSSTLSNSIGKYGGLIGYVYDKPAYIQISSGIVSTTENAKPDYYGGLIAELSDHGHFVQVGPLVATSSSTEENTGSQSSTGSISLNLNKIAGKTAAGGVVGQMPSGVISLSAQPAFEGETTIDAPTDKRGWVLGDRGNTLVYATTSWTTQTGDAAKNTNDTGVWGQVLRVGSSSPLNGLLTVNDTAHTVTVSAIPVPGTSTGGGSTEGGTTEGGSTEGGTSEGGTSEGGTSEGGTSEGGTSEGGTTGSQTTPTPPYGANVLGSAADFAALALRLQLNPCASLRFSADTPDDGDIATSDGITIWLKKSIDLSGTGLTCLMQDRVTDGTPYPVTIYGNGNTITLPSVTVYVCETNQAHNRQGLISRASTLEASNLTIATEGNGYDICVLTKNDDVLNQLNVGMLAAQITGAKVDLDGVVSNAGITVSAVNGCDTKAKVAGIIGVTDNETTSTTFENCKWTGSITDNCPSSTYLGGFLSIACNENKSKNRNVTVTDCEIGGSISKTAASNSYTPVGGLICTLYYGNTTLEINGLVADGVNIIVAGSTPNCGGILSYEWCRTTAWLKRVTIKNCKLTLPTSNTRFGGLIYKGNGICTLGDGTEPGITFDSGNTITGYSNHSDPSGLIYGKGFDFSQGLYLQVLKNGYKIINSGAVTLKLSYSNNNKKYFDELVGNTWTSSGMGIVSIAAENDAGERLIDTDNKCNTYQRQLTDYDYVNPYTRYYYNLDAFRQYGKDTNGNDLFNGDSTVTGNVDTPEKMVLLSARAVCLGDIAKYFYKEAPTTITKPASGSATLDLTGYSYYPIPCTGYTVRDVTIVFDNEKIEKAEASNKQPSNGKTQHALMHTGIFKDGSGMQTLTVDGLTLQGNVGQNVDQDNSYLYGALICGTVSGTDASNTFTLSLKNIELAGIKVNKTLSADSTFTAPLLIANIGSHVNLEMDGVWTRAKGSTETTAVYAQGTYAASSLIGNVGGDTGANIQLTFKNMALDGRTDENGSLHSIYGTHHTIFTKALFIESFRYSEASTCKGEYNFSSDGSWYTLGQELSNTEGGSVSGRNDGQQYWFFKQAGNDGQYVFIDVGGYDTTKDNEENAKTFFQSYRRYVGNGEEKDSGGKPSLKHHELDVNLSKASIVSGCGTYSHPYIISNGLQLIELMKALNDGGKNEGWEIILNENAISSTLATEGTHAANEDRKYICKGGQWVTEITAEDGSTSEQEKETSLVLRYLRNAYYKIQADEDDKGQKNIYLNKLWAGLGNASDNGAFSGVIVGDGSTTIHIKPGEVADSRYGGLIKYSRGSVVKDISIVFDTSPKITCSAVPTGSSDASFFGGVVGWCIGGDTIIDGVSVSYGDNSSTAPVLNGTSPHLAAVGGYVGLVGGYSIANGNNVYDYGGGVVFRGRVGNGLSYSMSNYFYLNPYVGRVLDGYAMGDGIDVDNTYKNYYVPNIGSGGLAVGEGTIQVTNSNGLWLLSAIVNSGAGNLAGDNAYTLGRTRTGDYSHVGSAYGSDKAQTDDSYWGGVENKNKSISYLTAKATGTGIGSIGNTSNSYAITIAGSCNMKDGYGNGFRGIGGSYGTIGNGNRLLNVASISSPEGKQYTITLQQNRKEYTDESQTWTSLGAGLFPVLNLAAAFSAKRLILAGTTGITYYSDSLEETVNPIPSSAKLMDVTTNSTVYRLGCSGAGLLAGTMKKATSTGSLSLNNIKIIGNVTGSATFAGGLIGLACIHNESAKNYIDNISVENCNYSSASIEGFACVGGFFGYAYADSISIIADSGYPMDGITVTSSNASIDQARTGIGALIGRCGVKNFTIKSNDPDKPMVFSGEQTITNNNQPNNGDRYATGGLIGLLGIRDNAKVYIQNISIQGTVEISNSKYNNSCGVLAGMIARYHYDKSFDNNDFTWNNGGNIVAEISNIKIAQKNDTVTIKNTKQGGVLCGVLLIATATLDNISIGSEDATVTIASETSASSSSLSGLLGTVATTAVTLTDVTLTKVNVWGNHGDGSRGSGLLLGYADNSATINIRNTKLTGCNVAVYQKDANVNAGIIYAELNGATVNGYNILVDGCTVGLSLSDSNTLVGFTAETGSSARIGLKSGSAYTPYNDIKPVDIKNYTGAGRVVLFGGKTNDQNVTLVGVSVKNCTTPMKEFGDGISAKRYAVRADYNRNAVTVEDGKTIDNASMITLVPSLPLPGIQLTSDGIGLTDSTPYSKQIITEGTTETNRTYFNVTDEIGKFNTTGDYKDCISTFQAVGENTFTETFSDFPVLVINSDEGTNADTIVRNYIALLTNVPNGTLSIPIDNITISCYYWKPAEEGTSAAFTQDDTRASLTKNSNTSKITIAPGGYDNQRSQFTLLDVSYDDPTQGGENAYHLYIPVIVKRVMRFKFWASAENGTSHYAGHYASLDQSAIGSNEDLITSLLTFQYQWTKEEWQRAVDSGLDLLWNFDKAVVFAYNGKEGVRLPTTTRLTLVDCNNQDLVYYGNYSSETISFSSFSSLSGDKQWSCNDAPLCDRLMLKEVDYDSTKDLAKFVRCESTDPDRTLRIKTQYYRPAKETDTDSICSIEVGLADDKLVEETYYLTLQTKYDITNEDVYSFLIQCGSRLANPKGKTGLPTTWIRYNESNEYSKNGSENRVVISNFYTQTMELTTEGSRNVMSSENVEISGSLKTTVTFRTTDGYSVFNNLKGERELRQKFCLSLKDQDDNPVPFPEGTTIQVGTDWYSVDPGYTYWLPYRDVDNWAPNDEGKQTSTVSTNFTLRFSTEGIISTFPERLTDTSADGIKVCASSSLSLNLDTLQRSNQRSSSEDLAKNRFYRKEMSLATLSYNAYDIAYPDQASGLSNLGINGRESSPASIPSAAVYDASALKNTASANKLKCRVDLFCKNDSGVYELMSSSTGTPGTLDSFLSSITITPKMSVNGSYKSATSEDGFVFSLPSGTIEWHSPVQIEVNLGVITGEVFERSNMYSNYKVLLTVELLGEKDGNDYVLDGSHAYDYIIYTNTKIIKELIS